MNKSTLSTALAVAMGGVSMSAQAVLTSSASLQFDAGAPIVTSCSAGNFTGSSCTLGGTPYTAFEVTDMGGSYFLMNQGNGNQDKTAISQFAPLHIGNTQTSGGQHTGKVDGSESPAIDNPWNFFGNTGMHSLTSAISVISDFGSTKTLDFSGWGVNWGDFGNSPVGNSGGTINMPGVATIVCSTSSCSDSSTYTLDMDVHVPAAFPSVPYSIHLEGHVNGGTTTTPPAVPVPAAAWLFGSGLVGLVGVARRRRNKS